MATTLAFWFVWLLALLPRPPEVVAATIQNEASGSFGGFALDESDGTVVLNRVGGPASEAVFEVDPTEVPLYGRERQVRVSLLPTMRPGDLGIETLRLRAGVGLTDLELLTLVSADGDTLTASTEGSEGDGDYAKETVDGVLEVSFLQPWAASGAPLSFDLTFDVIGPPGVVPFEIELLAGAKSLRAVPGNADGNPDNANLGELRILAGVDPDRSVAYAEPPVVLADGVTSAMLVAVLLGPDGQPFADKEVRFESSRPTDDVVIQPDRRTDEAGRVTGSVTSGVIGESTFRVVDVTDGISLRAQPTVAFSQGPVLRIEKSGGSTQAVVGDIVTYEIEIENLTDRQAEQVQILDRTPTGFQYLAGSARLDGVPIGDPRPTDRLRFQIGTVAGTGGGPDSSGAALGPDRTGNTGSVALARSASSTRTLSYALVIGSNVQPGEYVNSAVAVDACDACEISNRSEARVDVVVDDFFDRSLIIGKVFRDRNADGAQGQDEPGIGGVRVVLDDGSYSITDAHGRYHIRRVEPGQRLLKLDTRELGDGIEVVQGPTRVLWVSPGLLARANFGVLDERAVQSIGTPAVHGLELRAGLTARPVEIVGYASQREVLVNGTVVPLPGCSIEPRSGISSVIAVASEPAYVEVGFDLRSEGPETAADWVVEVQRASDLTPLARRAEAGPLPPHTRVELRADETSTASGLRYRLEVRYQNGTVRSTPWKRLGVQLISRDTALRQQFEGYRSDPSVDLASAQVDSEPVVLEADGRFQTEWSGTGDDLDLGVTQPSGARLSGRIPLPELELADPHPSRLGWGDERLALAADSTEIGRTWVAVDDSVSFRTSPRNRVLVDGTWIDPEADGTFRIPVRAPLGTDRTGLLVEGPGGIRRIFDLDLTLAEEDDRGRPVVLTPGVPNLAVALPNSSVLRSPIQTIEGRTDPGNRIFVNDVEVEVSPSGEFRERVELAAGDSQLHVAVEDPGGARGSISRDVSVTGTRLFLIALADATVGQMRTTGDLAGAGAEGRTETFSDGRVAYYLEGSIAGSVLIRSFFDTRRSELDHLFDDLDTYDESRLLTYLDPDESYPVFGDQSFEGRAAESPGKFYLAVQSEVADLLFGSFATRWSGTELSAYQRVLYGARARVETPVDPDYRTEVEAFVSEGDQVRIEAELEATGGSLYYLPHSDLIEGSEQVTVVVRHETTGLPLLERHVERNEDYQIAHAQGRIWFHQPLPSVTESRSLLGSEVLPGHPVFVRVTYETADPGRDSQVAGGRIVQQLGPHLRLGGTYVQERLGVRRQELRGLDFEVRLDHARFVGEWAESEGADSLRFGSDDGGLRFSRLAAGSVESGEAWKLAAEVDIAGWLGKDYTLKSTAYARRADAGFRTAGVLSGPGREQYGLGLTAGSDRIGTFDFRADRVESTGGTAIGGTGIGGTGIGGTGIGGTGTGGLTSTGVSGLSGTAGTERGAEAKRTTTSLLWTGSQHRRIRLAAELRAIRTEDALGRSLSAEDELAMRIGSKIAGGLSGTIEREQSLRKKERGRTTLGLEYATASGLTVGARGTTGTDGESALGSLRYDRGGRQYYIEGGSQRTGSTDRVRTIWGARQGLGEKTTVYTEYQWTRDPGSERSLRVWGAERRWDPRPGLAVRAHGEHSRADARDADLQRSALGASVAWKDGDRIDALTRGEVRFEDGSEERIQYFTDNEVGLALDPDWSVLGRTRWSRTTDRTNDEDEASLAEHSLGLAYRPVAHDRVNALGRYTHRRDDRPAVGRLDGRTRDIVSLEGAFDVTPAVELLGRYGARWQKSEFTDDASIRTLTQLSVGRVNFRLYGPFGLGTEYRIFAQREASDRKRGWMSELTFDWREHARVGLGYDFTDFEDDLDSEDDFTKQGWFLRLQGRY